MIFVDGKIWLHKNSPKTRKLSIFLVLFLFVSILRGVPTSTQNTV